MVDNSQISATLDWLTARLMENSTWRGMIAIAAGFGIHMQPDMENAIITAAFGLIGLINVIRKEKTGDTIVTNAPVTITTPTTITTEPKG